MNRLLLVPILLLLFGNILYVSCVLSSSSLPSVGVGENASVNLGSANSSQYINDSQSTFGSGQGVIDINWSLEETFFNTVYAATAAVIAASIMVLMSGIQDLGVSAIGALAFWMILWVALSSIGLSVMSLIPVLGYPLYVMLGIMYALGVWGEVHP